MLRDEPITAKQLRDALALASWDLVRAYFEHDLFDDEILRAQDSAGFVPLHTAIFHQAPQDIVERLMGEEPESMKRKKKIQKLLTQLTLAQTKRKPL